MWGVNKLMMCVSHISRQHLQRLINGTREEIMNSKNKMKQKEIFDTNGNEAFYFWQILLFYQHFIRIRF